MLGRCFFLTFTGKSGILYMYCTASFFPAVTPGRVATAPGAFLFLLGRPGNVSTCGLRLFPALLLYTRFQMRIAACPIPPHAAALPHGACIPQTRVPQARPSAKADTRTGPVSQTARHGLAYGRNFRFPTPCAGVLRGAPANFPGGPGANSTLHVLKRRCHDPTSTPKPLAAFCRRAKVRDCRIKRGHVIQRFKRQRLKHVYGHGAIHGISAIHCKAPYHTGI